MALLAFILLVVRDEPDFSEAESAGNSFDLLGAEPSCLTTVLLLVLADTLERDFSGEILFSVDTWATSLLHNNFDPVFPAFLGSEPARVMFASLVGGTGYFVTCFVVIFILDFFKGWSATGILQSFLFTSKTAKIDS